MTAAERRERGTLLCRQLADEVASIAPGDIGRWERAWEIVAGADTAFLVALTLWETTGADGDLPALRAAYGNVVTAWRRAVAEYEREGAER